MLIETIKISSFLFKWQSLAGAFIGALIPILISLFLFSYRSRNNFKRGLGQLEKFLVYSINNLYDLRQELDLFIERLDSLINEIKNHPNSNAYFLGTTNFPLPSMEHDINVIDRPTRSLYLSNKLMRCYSMLKDVNLSLSDLKEEFRLIVSRNYDVVLSYKDPSRNIGISTATQVHLYLEQLEAMRITVKTIIIEKNIPLTIKSFLGARIILLKYIKFSGFFYRIYYEGFGGSISKKDNSQILIEKKFEKELEKDFFKFEEMYKGKHNI